VNYTATMTVSQRDLQLVPERVKIWARAALGKSARVVRDNVRDLTPRWKGGLVRGVQAEPRMGGDEQAIYAKGVVALTHEFNGHWSKMPPKAAIEAWVAGKLGIGGKEGKRIAYMVRRKILRSGLTLPNVEGRGKMFQRTYQLMRASGFHMHAFMTALQQNLGTPK